MRTPSFEEFTADEKKDKQIVESSQQSVPVVQKQQDPFTMSKYNNSSFPDVPIQTPMGLTESLLNNDEVPEHIKKENWWVFHKDNTLTFLDEERKRAKMLSFDISKIDKLNTMPYYDYTFEAEMEFGVLRNVFETKLDRALGFKGTAQKNERIVLQSQFQESRMINDSDNGGQIREGFFKRLLGRRN